MRTAVFLDRDGVIIENRADHVKSLQEIQFLPGVFDALARLASAKHILVIATNQSGVGRGIIPEEQADLISHEVVTQIRNHGGRIDAYYMCPHPPDAGCSCRKPATGMFTAAADALALDLHHSFVIGDALTDMQAAQAISAQGILVLTGRGRTQLAKAMHQPWLHFHIAADLADATDYILHPVKAGLLGDGLNNLINPGGSKH